MALENNTVTAAETWFKSFAAALVARDASAIAALFLPQGWLRDILVFSWKTRSLEGHAKIAAYLSEHLPRTKVSAVKLSDNEHLRPAAFAAGPVQGVEFGYTFETDIAHCKGFVKILPDGNGAWKALTASTIMDDLKGYEERSSKRDPETNTEPIWGKVNAAEREAVEANPHVVILGGGQTGLQAAARLKQMNIPTLVIERNARVGDHWRQRYASLALHTTREHHTLLYQQWPSTWPVYTPRDKVADALEGYAVSQDLVLWTNSTTSGRPTYDTQTKRWTLPINRAGKQVVLHPAHIVLATGGLADPNMPKIPGQDRFKGPVIHSVEYMDPEDYKGKHVLVIGAGNTAIDICQDLATQEPGSVTMVQRSSTCVVSRSHVRQMLEHLWPPGVPTEIADLKVGSVPTGFLKKTLIASQAQALEDEKELHDKLKKAGIRLNMGPEGAGHPILIVERAGGFWLDKGGADLLASGAIKAKVGAEPVAFTETGLKFSDGTELKADAVIFATGYVMMREVNRRLFGSEVIDATSEVWGIDEEGELRGVWKPCGYPGFWYIGGDFQHARLYSKSLALQLKAMELGLMKA